MNAKRNEERTSRKWQSKEKGRAKGVEMKRKEQQSRDEMFQDYKHQIKGMQQQEEKRKNATTGTNQKKIQIWKDLVPGHRSFSAWTGVQISKEIKCKRKKPYNTLNTNSRKKNPSNFIIQGKKWWWRIPSITIFSKDFLRKIAQKIPQNLKKITEKVKCYSDRNT